MSDPKLVFDFTKGAMAQAWMVASARARSTDPVRQVNAWERYSGLCDNILRDLDKLIASRPEMDFSASRTVILEYRQEAQERLCGVLREIEAAKTPLPKGLFPEAAP